jgi:metal-dependent amidase/aminoacylase/carboxypeptidase family protein
MSASIQNIVKSNLPDFQPYEKLYKQLHAHPELSHQESETAASIFAQLQRIGIENIYQNIGGHGLAAVIENGPGKTVLLRADIDGLPVQERTGLEYSSQKKMIDIAGNERPVMHACGHDMHIISLLAAAELLYKTRSEWSGTLILCFQPAEELGAGAVSKASRSCLKILVQNLTYSQRAMVEGGLYDKVPKPDILLGAHVLKYRTGTIGTRRGAFMASADSLQYVREVLLYVLDYFLIISSVTLHGRGSHGSQPQCGIDPVVMAASTVMRLQTIASREVDPSEGCVLTIGALNAGSAENVIPDRAELKLNIRSFSKPQRSKILESIKRIVEAESLASNAPTPPELTATSSFPVTTNDLEVTAKLEKSFSEYFPPAPNGYLRDVDRLYGSEDFSLLASMIDRPYSFFVYGGTAPDIWDKAVKEDKIEEIPTNHSPFFAPVIQPTLQTGAEGYALGALTWLSK